MAKRGPKNSVKMGYESTQPRSGVLDPNLLEFRRRKKGLINKFPRYILVEHWLVEKLKLNDNIYPEDYLRLIDPHPTKMTCVIFQKICYDLSNNYDAMRLYNHITGKDEKMITWQEYAQMLKERRNKNVPEK